jgi:hypothetical protein
MKSSEQSNYVKKNQIQTFEDLSELRDTSSLNTHQVNVEHEKMLVKYEADIRQHISIEQQLQIYIESIKQRLEELEKDSETNNKELEVLKQENKVLWMEKSEDQILINKLKEEK